MSDTKKIDALENIKELKNFDASKLGNLSARIRTARGSLDETLTFVKDRVAEAVRNIEAEKIKAEAEAQKAALAEALINKNKKAEVVEDVKPEKREKIEKTEKTKETVSEPKIVQTEKIEITQKSENSEQLKEIEEIKAEEQEKAEKKRNTKKKVDEFFDLQEFAETGEPKPQSGTISVPEVKKGEAESNDTETAASAASIAAPNDSIKTEEKPHSNIKGNDPVKRAQAEAGMTTSYSSGNRGSFDRNNQAPRDNRDYRGRDYQDRGRPQGQGYQGQSGYQGQGYQGQTQGGYQGQGYQGQSQGGYQSQGYQGQSQGYQGQRQGGYQGQRQGGYQGQGGGGYQGQRAPFQKDGAQPFGARPPRPAGGAMQRPGGPRTAPPIGAALDNARKEPPKKKTNFSDDKKALTKKALIQKGYLVEDITLGEDDDIVTNKRYKVKKAQKRHEFIQPVAKIDSAVITTENIDIKVLSEKIGKTAAEIVKKLFLLGITKTINESIDFAEAELIAAEFGITLTQKLEKTYEDVLEDFNIDEEFSDEATETRPPVVTIMGHVDHGKTSLLDYIRKANVAEGEAGGITQHIGAYTVTLNGKPITFIDTPGHEAFTAMRARGAQITDIAILVVAVDDGVMPQTIEAINHAKAAGVSVIVAINKIDKPAADVGRIKQQVSEHGLIPEEWGGEVPMIGVSAKAGTGVQELLENILTLAEFKELKANPKRAARGTIIEAKLDKGRGPVATVLVQNGTLRIADTIVAGTAICRVRAMIDDKGKNIKEAGPSVPVSVLGFDSVPEAGDNIFAVADEKLAKQVIGERSSKIKYQKVKTGVKMSLEDVYNKINEGLIKDLNLIIKADVQGSAEALNQALLKISNEEVRVNIIHSGVGAVNESDIMLAGTSSAVVIGFNVRPDAKAKAAAERDEVEIKVYRIIYDAIEDIEKAMKGMLAPKFKEVILGQASVRQVFKVSNIGTIAGCMVINGKITRSAQLRLLRDNVIIHEGSVASLKRFKEDAKEVATGFECGLGITDYNDIKEGDVIEAFVKEQIEVI
ncbi:MAG: translation initiation factor IF-2 [Clostridiales bacterium]|jgi:translation initiation factor IF-2|nr:translation initiation factor IF-2 [Clostridiales bacterium]